MSQIISINHNNREISYGIDIDLLPPELHKDLKVKNGLAVTYNQPGAILEVTAFCASEKTVKFLVDADVQVLHLDQRRTAMVYDGVFYGRIICILPPRGGVFITHSHPKIKDEWYICSLDSMHIMNESLSGSHMYIGD